MLARLIVVLSLSGTTRAELWVADAACGFHAGLLAPGHNWNGPKQAELKKTRECIECLNVGLWTLVSCPRLSHNQLCVLIVPFALLGSDWSISLLHVSFLLTLSGSWRYQLFSPASLSLPLAASETSQAPAAAASHHHHHHHCLSSKGGVMLSYPLRTDAFHWQISSASKDCLWGLGHIFNFPH